MQPQKVSLTVLVLATGVVAQTQFVPLTPAGIITTSPQVPLAADFDGDGDLDLFANASLFSGQPPRRLLRNDGNSRFTDVSVTALPVQAPAILGAGAAVAVDIDGDGDLDLFSSLPGSVAIWRNLGNGTFVDTGFVDSGSYTDLVAADFDGDGDLDVAASGQPIVSSGNSLFVNQGTGSFVRANVLPQQWATAIAATDLDGDGDQDLLLGSNVGLVVVRNDGAQTFTDVTATWLGPQPATPARDVVVGDLDADGDVDVIVTRAGYDDVLRNTGVAFVVGGTLPTVGNTTRLALVDVDEDGRLDLWRAGGAISLLLGNGLGGFTSGAARIGSIGAAAPQLLPFDSDRDGDIDLLICEPFSQPVLQLNRHRDLRPDVPRIGQPWQPTVWSQPGYAAAPHPLLLGIGLLPLPQPLVLPGIGALGIDLSGPVVLLTGQAAAPSYVAAFPLLIPNVPQLSSLPLYLQALVVQAPGPARLSAASTAVIF